MLSIRCEVALVKRLAAPAAAASATGALEGGRQVAPPLASICLVEQPQEALLVAYAMHCTKTAAGGAAAGRFMESQFQHLMPITSLRTTPREQRMLHRYMEICSTMLGPTGKTLRKDLLGPLDPNLWTLGLMVPIKQPPTDAKAHLKALKKDLSCRQDVIQIFILFFFW
jgi:hypothetical protein